MYSGTLTIQTNTLTFYTTNTNLVYSFNPNQYITKPIYTTNTKNGTSMKVDGDIDVNGKIKIKGRDLEELMQKIQDRLAILLEPDQEKLDNFAALKKAYEQYKILDALCTPKDDKC